MAAAMGRHLTRLELIIMLFPPSNPTLPDLLEWGESREPVKIHRC